jgi:broad specificity phosphatase PhoE
MMFNNPFKLPTYSEWKESVEKIQCRCNEVLERLVRRYQEKFRQINLFCHSMNHEVHINYVCVFYHC